MNENRRTSALGEIEAIRVAFAALESLTPEERERALRWLNSRITDDLEKGWRASYELGVFFMRAGAE